MSDLKIIPRAEIKNIQNQSGELSLVVKQDNSEFNSERNLLPRNVDKVEILDEKKRIDSADGLENELLITKNNRTIFNIDINGNLIISDDYADRYSINELGELIYER